MCVSQNFKNYDRERTHSLSWDDISLFCKESFGSVPRRATDTFSKVCGGGGLLSTTQGSPCLT